MVSIIGKTLLDRYQVVEHIGQGGMAEVYKVFDKKRNAHLAMKVLHENLAIDKVFMRRFKREAKTLARLKHPSIVRFYGIEQAGSLAFMLLEYIDGKNLKRLLFDEGGPMPPHQILAIMEAVCGALQYAHNKGHVHCDVKPGNIMISTSGKVLLTDFGIARMTDEATATMVGAGTPAYMAPEQVRGEDPVPQTDFYALGIALFEMLTGGERPFTGEQARTTGSTSEKVRWEQMHLDPPSPRKWNPQVSSELEGIVLKCLEKEHANRYQNAVELLNEFKKVLGEVESVPAIFPQTAQLRALDEEGSVGLVAKVRLFLERVPRPGLWLGVAGLAIVAMAMFSSFTLGRGDNQQASDQYPNSQEFIQRYDGSEASSPPPAITPKSTNTLAVSLLTPLCPNNLDLEPRELIPNCAKSRLCVGDRVILEEDIDYITMRSWATSILEDYDIGMLKPGDTAKVLHGPQCSRSEKILWKVRRTSDGQEGWVLEGDGMEFFLKPKPGAPRGTEINCYWDSEFILDVTIPDGTIMYRKTYFTKTWRIENTGSCIWKPGEVSWRHIDGHLMGAESKIELTKIVLPGEKINISVEFIAPNARGTYKSWWQLVSQEIGGFGKHPYVLIEVVP